MHKRHRQRDDLASGSLPDESINDKSKETSDQSDEEHKTYLFKCEYCDYTTTTKKGKNIHQKLKHKEDNKTKGPYILGENITGNQIEECKESKMPYSLEEIKFANQNKDCTYDCEDPNRLVIDFDECDIVEKKIGHQWMEVYESKVQ